MNNVMELELVSKREISRYEQTNSRSLYFEDEVFFLFPRKEERNGITTYDVSSVAKTLGIKTPFFISDTLYALHIMNGENHPIKNIETLCHAFLYAVDCVQKDSCILEFTVPGIKDLRYQCTAMGHGPYRKNILITGA